VIEVRDHEGLLGLWSSKDLTMHQQMAGADDLEPDERAVLDGIFSERGDGVALSDLENDL